MALGDDILTILSDYSAGYKLMRQKLRGSAYSQKREKPEINPQTLYITLSRLEKRGFVKKVNKIWTITQKGKEFLRQKLKIALPSHSRLKKIPSRNVEKNLVIVFDVPEKYRRKRTWLRAELILLDFTPLQKSVWLGPAPLPRAFIEALNQLNILRYIKFFETKEKEII